MNSSFQSSKSDSGRKDKNGSQENLFRTCNENIISSERDFSENDSSSDNQVILCLFYRKSKLAAAVYIADTSEVHIMYDVVDLPPDFKLVSSLFLQIKPTHVVTCSSLQGILLAKVHSLLTGEEINISPSADPPSYSDKLQFIPVKEFRYSTCKRSLLEMKLPSEPENATEAERHTHIMSMIDLSAEVLVSTMGGLLYFLKRALPKINMAAVIGTPVLSIHTLSLKNVVWMNEETTHSLQIFVPLVHPSTFKWTLGPNKEGLSIFSILNRCHSRLGTKHMRVLLSQPTRDIEVLHKRHQVVDFCLQPVNEQVVKSLSDSIAHIKSPLKILTRMTNAQASVSQWKSFYDTIYNSVLVAETCKAYYNDIELFREITDCLCDSLFIMSHCIDRTMDFENSFYQNRVVVKQGISDDLDTLKENQTQISVVLGEVADSELQELPDYIESCSIVYIPACGYLLAIPVWNSNLTEEQLISIPNLKFQFSAEELVYYKSARCLELDTLLGDIQMKIVEIESLIVLRLVQYIQRNIHPLVKLTSLVAELDCLIAFGHTARNFNLVKPIVILGKQIQITRGRHLLQELCVDMFVPNDTHSSEEDGYIKIITGPNASGKSVYLKQVALIVYLAHIGSYVPADRAVIGLVDQIHTRIQPVESISTLLSAFMVDLRQMSQTINNATSNSLIIMDEFGKGTTEIDGLGILAACLQHFINKNNNSPHLFVSTHFLSLLTLLPPSNYIRYQHFEHMVDSGELVYLYRLKEGIVERSFALQVAQTYCPDFNLEKATEILDELRGAREFRANEIHKIAQLTRRRTFLQDISKAVLDEEQLEKIMEELVSLE